MDYNQFDDYRKLRFPDIYDRNKYFDEHINHKAFNYVPRFIGEDYTFIFEDDFSAILVTQGGLYLYAKKVPHNLDKLTIKDKDRIIFYLDKELHFALVSYKAQPTVLFMELLMRVQSYDDFKNILQSLRASNIQACSKLSHKPTNFLTLPNEIEINYVFPIDNAAKSFARLPSNREEDISDVKIIMKDKRYYKVTRANGNFRFYTIIKDTRVGNDLAKPLQPNQSIFCGYIIEDVSDYYMKHCIVEDI